MCVAAGDLGSVRRGRAAPSSQCLDAHTPRAHPSSLLIDEVNDGPIRPDEKFPDQRRRPVVPCLTYDGFQSPAAGPASGRVSPESHDAIVTINAWS